MPLVLRSTDNLHVYRVINNAVQWQGTGNNNTVTVLSCSVVDTVVWFPVTVGIKQM